MDSQQGRQQARMEIDTLIIPLTTITNDNWRGKTQATDRRRIQNRLNQRAYRERRRPSNQAAEQQRQRRSSDTSLERDRNFVIRALTSASSSSSSVEARPARLTRSTTTPAVRSSALGGGVGDAAPVPQATQTTEPETIATLPDEDADPSIVTLNGHRWDELGQLINRNFVAAVVANANLLGLDFTALRTGIPVFTPQSAINNLPPDLEPIPLQRQVPHDVILDTIPHMGLRSNILNAVARDQLDTAALSREIRASGALDNDGARGGLIVGGFAPQMSSWELSEGFVRRWIDVLLEGCDDLIEATNRWRTGRGEPAITLSQTT